MGSSLAPLTLTLIARKPGWLFSPSSPSRPQGFRRTTRVGCSPS